MKRKEMIIAYLILLILLILVGCQRQDNALMDKDLAGHDNVAIAVPDEPMDGEWVTYGEGYTGYLVTPKNAGVFPGVIMIREWWD